MYTYICMGGVKKFISEQNVYEERLAKLMNWNFILNQSKGSSHDYITPGGSKIEVKFDWDSIKTGNHYLEFAQTSDGGINWLPSGFSISEIDADYGVVVNNDWLRIIKISNLKEFLIKNRNKLKTTQTRIGINYNAPGQLSKAYLIPFNLLDEITMIKMPSLIKKN